MKRLTALLLALLLLTQLLPAVHGADSAAEEWPKIVAHKPFIKGNADGTFAPNASLSRAELAQILYNLGGFPKGPDRFSDVEADAWFAKAVNALAAAGLLRGYEDGTFRPGLPITRAELVTVLGRYAGKSTKETAQFSDVGEAHWATRAIALAQAEGWVTGYPDGTFHPDAQITRAEAVTALNRFLGRIPDRAAIDGEENLKFFPDVPPDAWYYYQVMEAASNHTAVFNAPGAKEHWRLLTLDDAVAVDGFYCIDGKLCLALDGKFLRSPAKGTWAGMDYVCAGEDGSCTVRTEVLTLATGELVFLSGGKLMAVPGDYADGFRVKAGHLYAVENGHILRAPGEGVLNGVTFTCAGADGICQTPDWTLLDLAETDLSVFGSRISGKPTCDYADVSTGDWFYEAVACQTQLGIMKGVGQNLFEPYGSVDLGQILKVAVTIYEDYFHVEYPPAAGKPWYQPYVDRALDYGILDAPLPSYEAPATRGDVVRFLWRALRGRELEAKNTVTAIPDVDAQNPLYAVVMDLYRAGIMGGADKTGTAKLQENITRAELATLVTRLLLPQKRLSFTLEPVFLEELQYGTSGSGRYPLIAYRLGSGKNVMVLTFAIHGWEDNWARDGAELVYLANQVKTYLNENRSLVTDGNWTVYILPCLNPDGLYLGTTNNGPGRCTTTYYDGSGNLIRGSGKGIDMNRCFPYKFQARADARNFNGTAPLQCPEARALKTFVENAKGSGKNILVDTHGWFSQIITTGGMGGVYRAFSRQFPNNRYTYMAGGSGYFSAWAGFVQGYDACLLELPSSVTSHNAFLSAGCVWRFEAAVQELLTSYTGASSNPNVRQSVYEELDGN